MTKSVTELIGETSSYDKKREVERGKPKSWLKSVSSFANGGGGMLIFGISDDGAIVGLKDVQGDAEFVSEVIKAKLDPVPSIDLSIQSEDGKDLVLLNVRPGSETPYYYIGDGQRLAFVRIGNESVVADRVQLKQLVLKGSGATYDSLSSGHRFEDMSFSRLKSVHYKVLRRSFEQGDFVSWGIIGDDGQLTNAGALMADDCPFRHARIFCTRWNGLTKTNGLGEAIDDIELSGSIIGQLQDAVSFVRINSKRKWWKEKDHREELPDFPDRAVIEAVTNALIHRDYLQKGSEIHIDMFDDRLEIFSPGGMCDGREIQKLDFSTVASKRRNPLLADFFSRLGFMERRGSGLSKIMDAYCAYERFAPVRRPEFVSDSTEFRITMWNINYNLENAKWNCIKENADCTKGGYDSVHEKIHGQLDEKRENKQFCEGGYSAEKFCAKGSSHVENNGDDCIKDLEHCIKDLKKRKAFIQATRKLYHSIESNPKICVKEMAESLNLSVRQIQYHLKTLQMLNKVARIGGRKLGEWKIIDKDYVTGFGE